MECKVEKSCIRRKCQKEKAKAKSLKVETEL